MMNRQQKHIERSMRATDHLVQQVRQLAKNSSASPQFRQEVEAILLETEAEQTDHRNSLENLGRSRTSLNGASSKMKLPPSMLSEMEQDKLSAEMLDFSTN